MTPDANEPEVDPRQEAVRAFGRYLLRERELRGLSPEDVARVTRLASAVIDAIESGDPERMPPRGYLVGYLRSYAAAVGLDADDVVLRYQEAAGIEDLEAATNPARPGARAAAGTPAPRLSRRTTVIAVAIVVVIALAAAVAARRGSGGPEIRGRKSAERAPYRAPAAP